jgi:uncharacterized protein (DUF2235 family)
MKNIALFCDGTWQNLSQAIPTNVARLARSLAPSSKTTDGAVACEQVVYYDNGVGVGQGVFNTATRLIGGGLGRGLEEKILNAYQFLCLNYCPGDRIYIFGFSRGAYTARSLGGFLRKCWILRRENASDADDALRLYRSDQLKPDSPELKAFRLEKCHPAEPFLGGRTSDPVTAARALENDATKWACIQYLGVWDTVGALGIPKTLPFALDLNSKYRFHDTSLSRFVLSARHAVSIDERRSTFAPTLWDNLDALNENAGASDLPYEKRPYQQSWFPGHHAGVGGGGADTALSVVPLHWIAEGATQAGLDFDQRALHSPPEPDACAAFSSRKATFSSLAMRLVGGESDREGPSGFFEISEAARTRWSKVPGYRPKPLNKFTDKLK